MRLVGRREVLQRAEEAALGARDEAEARRYGDLEEVDAT
jgi:hypothetical protein